MRALEKARGDRTAAAEAAGLTPRKFEAKLREHGLEETRRPRRGYSGSAGARVTPFHIVTVGCGGGGVMRTVTL